MLIFTSFKPNTGSIVKISVYWSEFGKERMENEEQNGPQNIWGK